MEEKMPEEMTMEKNLTIDKETGTAIILGVFLGGILIVLGALGTRNLNREKGKARFAIEKTGIRDYDREDRVKIRKNIRKYSKKAGKARSRKGVQKAEAAFNRSVEGIRTTAEKLADMKIDTVEKLYEGGFVRGKMKYGTDFSVSDYVERVKAAPDMESLKKIMKELR